MGAEARQGPLQASWLESGLKGKNLAGREEGESGTEKGNWGVLLKTAGLLNMVCSVTPNGRRLNTHCDLKWPTTGAKFLSGFGTQYFKKSHEFCLCS